MKKILFIIPPYSSFEKYDIKKLGFKMPNFTAPYGILSLISYINKDKKHDVRIIDLGKIIIDIQKDLDDCNFKEVVIENIKSNITKFNPDYIGISVLFDSNFSHLKYMAPLIKEFYPEGTLLVGGGLATAMYNMLLNEIPSIDAICYGEGEIPLKKLLETGDFTSSFSWITKESIKNNLIPRHEFIEDLDEIPIIDFRYVNVKDYDNRSPLLVNSFSKEKEKIEMNIHTSRGCPFNCIFCASSKTHGKRIRYMSLNKVKETIKNYIDKYNMNVLLIEDDNFFFKKERVLKILKIIKDFNVRVEIPIGAAVSKIDDDVAQALYEAGVRRVSLAVESGSDYVLQKLMHKPLKKAQIPKAVNSLKKFNIGVHAFIVIGLPNELDEHRKETYDMLLDLEIDWVHIFIAIPLTGSKLYEVCEEKGYLSSKNYDNYDISNCNIKAPGVDPEKIKEEAFYMNMVINYILNSNYKNGNYDVCLPYFLNVSKMYPNNAVVHYMLYKTIVNKDKYWSSMFQKFKEDQLI